MQIKSKSFNFIQNLVIFAPQTQFLNYFLVETQFSSNKSIITWTK